MSYQSMLQQQELVGGWEGGNGSRLTTTEVGRGLTLNTGNFNSNSGYGADLTLFSPSDLLSPSSRQLASSTFNWQSLLCGQASNASRWQVPETPALQTAFSAPFGIDVEQNVTTRGNGDAQIDLCLAHESDGVVSEVDVEAKEASWTNNLNSEKDAWRNFGDLMAGNVKQEDHEHVQDAEDEHNKSRKRLRQSRSQVHPEIFGSFEPSISSSQSDSDSEDSDRLKRESSSRKRKTPGQDADGNITWTDESVRFLFETYDAIHKRLWEESKGKVKYQKKWTPILKAMQSKFGKHFTKKQCQSKYWSVRRECTEYRIMSMKAAATDPMWNPSIAGRELLKPKFYDVWLDVSAKNLAVVTNSTGKGNVGGSGEPLIDSSRALREDGQPVKARSKDSNTAMVEMQRLMLVEIQASEKREESMKNRAVLMMELLTQHIEHVENRVNSIDEGRNPQLQLLERVNLKLEKVLDGFAVLNQHLSMLH